MTDLARPCDAVRVRGLLLSAEQRARKKVRRLFFVSCSPQWLIAAEQHRLVATLIGVVIVTCCKGTRKSKEEKSFAKETFFLLLSEIN